MNEYTFNLTESAIEMVSKKLEERNSGALRVGVKGGGCSGFRYIIEFDDKSATDKDIVFEFQFNSKNFYVYCDKKSILFLNGVVLNWKKTLKYQGFEFVNSDSRSSCGCGESFSI